MAPVLAAGGYPVILDVVSAASRLPHNKLFASSAAALAPSWEELERAGITAARAADVASVEVPERADYVIQMRFVGGAVARALAQFSANTCGLVFRAPHRFGNDDLIFFERAVREARLTGLAVGLEMAANLRKKEKLSRLIADCLLIAPAEHARDRIDILDPATRLLALCQQGAPLSVIDAAAEKKSHRFGWRIEAGFDGRTWAWLPAGPRKSVLAGMPVEERRRAHAALFRAWPASGWDYLRRAVHAWKSREPQLMGGQAAVVTYALRNLGPEFAGRHFRALAEVADRLGIGETAQARLWGNAARLIAETRSGAPPPSALPMLRRAVALSDNPADRAENIYELANHLARTRRPSSLARARAYYATGFAVLPSIEEEEERLRKEIRLLNGLALVAYHERRNQEALDLEQRAHRLADHAAGQFKDVASWAKALLNTNTAKLLVHRFADPAAAQTYLASSAASADLRVRRKATVDLARLAFDRGDFANVVSLLADAYDNTLPDENEVEEIVSRAMYAIACLTTGDTETAQRSIARMDYLCSVLDLSGGRQITAAIKALIATHGQGRSA